jgi:adenylate cyclase class IV
LRKLRPYFILIQEMVIDNPFIIYPRMTFEVTVRLLGGLMALGYTITTILKRTSHGFSDDRLCIKIDKLEQLQRKYVQVQKNCNPKAEIVVWSCENMKQCYVVARFKEERNIVAEVAKQLGLEGSYIPHSYIEQIQREKLITGLMVQYLT